MDQVIGCFWWDQPSIDPYYLGVTSKRILKSPWFLGFLHRSTYGWIYHINPSYSAKSETFLGINKPSRFLAIHFLLLFAHPKLWWTRIEFGNHPCPCPAVGSSPALPKAWEIPGEVHQKRLTRPLRAPARKRKSQRALQFEVSSPVLEGWTLYIFVALDLFQFARISFKRHFWVVNLC